MARVKGQKKAGTGAKPKKGNAGPKQKGRQAGSSTGREGAKSNNQFFRHPGQGMRGKEGGQREASREPGQESTGSDTRKNTRPPAER